MRLKNILRLYVVLGLLAAASFSLSYYSLLPLALLALSLYIWLRSPSTVEVAASYGTVFILPLFLETALGAVLAAAFSLPLLAYVDIMLRSSATPDYRLDSAARRQPTDLALVLVGTGAGIGILGIIMGNRALELTSIAALLYFVAIGIIILWGLPAKPLRESKTLLRVLAGSRASAQVDLVNLVRLPGRLYLQSPYPWIKMTSSVLPLAGPKVSLIFSVVPPLAGPASPGVQAVVLDPWGLSQTRLTLEPLQLHVIPRATYAAWLAKRYLEKARPGLVISHTPSPQLGGIHAARKGGEFYGTRPYLPGDNPRVIDWKSSARLAQIIVQEFVEPYTSSPLLLVNLAVADEEQADKLAFSVLTTALTLAREGVPAAIAAYNDSEVVAVTDVLTLAGLVRKALSLTGSIKIYPIPTRYLGRADITRLRMNQARLSQMPGESAQKLGRLLSFEYDALRASAESNPATVATTRGLSRNKQLAQLLIISHLNHDAEALTLLASKVSSMGIRPLFLEIGKTVSRGQLTSSASSRLHA